MALDITHLQFVLLAGIGWLTRGGAVVMQVELAAFCKIDGMQVSQVVRKLEVKGLVKRAIHPTDIRARVLTLTPAGAKVLNQALPIIEQLDADFFGDNQTTLLAELQVLLKNSAVQKG
jgi:DNA-binding MarR family transcriptional regulator